jgi:hypothetical protein
VPALSLPGSIKEKVTVTGEVVAVPEVKEVFNQIGTPEIE